MILKDQYIFKDKINFWMAGEIKGSMEQTGKLKKITHDNEWSVLFLLELNEQELF